jgi:hypothetical protein
MAAYAHVQFVCVNEAVLQPTRSTKNLEPHRLLTAITCSIVVVVIIIIITIS